MADKSQQVTLHRLHAVLPRVGAARSTWLQWVKDGLAPKPVRIGPRAVGWRSTDIDAWLESRKETA